MDLWSVPHCRWLPNPEVKHLRLLLLRLAELSGSFHSMWIGGVPTTEDLPLPGQIAEQETCSSGNSLPGLVLDMLEESDRKEEPFEELGWLHSTCQLTERGSELRG